MSNNLLEQINEYITGDVISKLADFLGESPKNTTSALSNTIPSLLASLVAKSADSEGASSLFNLLSQGKHDGSILNNLAAAFAGGEDTSKLLSTGASLLSSILGNKTENVTSLLANASGISKSSSSSLMGLLMPMILGILGKTVNTQNITSASGLASLLAKQSGFLKNFLPAGLTSILGVAGLSDFGKAAPHAAATSAYAEEDESDGFGKWLPWLLIPAILALGWGLLKYIELPKLTTPDASIQQSATTPEPATATTTTPAVTTTPEAAAPITTPAPATAVAPEATAPDTTTAAVAPAKTPEASPTGIVAPIVEKVGEFFENTLPSGFAIKAAKNGVENKLIGFLEDSGRAIDDKTWFTMDGMIFDTGKATLKPASQAQVTNIIEIMKAYPNVKIKIGGYTDNTGNAKANLKLSSARANTVKNALVTGGIDAARLDAEGYGIAHPVASNDTPAGRQQNRRIDVMVTAK